MVKNPSADAGDSGPTLGQEDPLEEEMTTHSRILAWEADRAALSAACAPEGKGATTGGEAGESPEAPLDA